MLTVVVVIHLMIVLAMIGVVLLQKSEGGGLVSSTSGFMTGRGTANVLTRTTALLAVGFFVTSLALSWLAGLGRHPASILNSGGAPASRSWGGAHRPRPRRRPPRPPAARKCRNRSRPKAMASAIPPARTTKAGGFSAT
jgi:preprotein translocase subunit SecG